MEATLHDLGRILLFGIPTFVLVILLNFYLRFAFFKPLEVVLAKRYELTEGARKAASAALNSADARVAQYQATLQTARAEVYEVQEKISRDLEAQHAESIQKARTNADIMLRGALAEINKEAEAVRQELFVQSEILADQIANSLAVGKAA
jgi:F0F1-type ATP synthase membrane subunit b/b'